MDQELTTKIKRTLLGNTLIPGVWVCAIVFMGWVIFWSYSHRHQAFKTVSLAGPQERVCYVDSRAVFLPLGVLGGREVFEYISPRPWLPRFLLGECPTRSAVLVNTPQLQAWHDEEVAKARSADEWKAFQERIHKNQD